MTRYLTTLLLACYLTACTPPAAPTTQRDIVISMIGTNDVHGVMLPTNNRGGLTAISGYVNAVRSARAADGGAVLLIDAGDMWQGTLESNITEGAAVVAAYNALGYASAAIGNHEFDFGPAGPAPIPESDSDDPRGALKLRAAEADFPFLAANLIDQSTGMPVNWDNVYPAVIVEAAGIKFGIIGVMTINALNNAIAANTVGLTVAPLADTIVREARALREAGASIIVVTAHAGGECTDFSDPTDISSCKMNDEIFNVASALPEGLVDHIFAGHVHEGIAHIVNGISITSSYSRTRAFSRVDMIVDRRTGRLMDKKIFPPTFVEQVARYEGQDATPDQAVVAIADRAAAFAAEMKREKIGVFLATPFVLTDTPESALGNLYTDAMLGSFDADIAIHIVNSGIRAYLPAGDLTFGSVFEMSPFDNTVAVIDLSGAELRQVIAEQSHIGENRIGFSGMRVFVECVDMNMSVSMQLLDGREVQDSDSIAMALVNYLALGGDSVVASVMPAGGYEFPADAPLARDVIIEWLRDRGGTISANEFLTVNNPKWNLPDSLGSECRLN